VQTFFRSWLLGPGLRSFLASALLARGADGDLERAEGLLREAESDATEREPVNLPMIHEVRARLAALRGDDAERAAALERGLAAAREIGAEGWAVRFEADLGAPAVSG
jgi:ATP/maltotriose-dependent transcriptional regulator MalT